MAQLKQVWLTLGYAPGAEGCDISSSNKPLTWSVKKKKTGCLFFINQLCRRSIQHWKQGSQWNGKNDGLEVAYHLTNLAA